MKLCLALVGLAACAAPKTPPRCAYRQVVLVEGRYAGPDQPTNDTPPRGAGLIVDVEKNRVYILTASHVIAGADTIEVRWHGHNEPTTAAVVFSTDDVSGGRDDYALLVVPNDHGLRARDMCPIPDADIGSSERVTYLGHPAAPEFNNWRSGHGVLRGSQESSLLVRRAADAPPIGGGFSGGGLYDSRGRLIGMVIRVDRATPLPYLRNELRNRSPPNYIDEFPEARERRYSVQLGGGRTLGGDAYVDNLFALELRVAYFHWHWRPRPFRVSVGGQADVSGVVSRRTPVVHEYPGEPPETLERIRHTRTSGGAHVVAVLRLSDLWMSASLGGRYEGLTEYEDSYLSTNGALSVSAAVGYQFFDWGSIYVRFRRDVGYQEPLLVLDSGFTFAGAPDDELTRPVDDFDAVITVGIELRK